MAGRARDPTAAATPGPRAGPADSTLAPPPRALVSSYTINAG